MERFEKCKAFICDMDGVLYHGNRLLPDVPEFVDWLKRENKSFLFLTNSSAKTPRELQQKMARLGVEIGEEHFYTCAQATASFLSSQCPKGSAFIIGEAGVVNALYSVGYSMNDVNPDYVVVSESSMYSYERITHAINLVCKGAGLIGTNSDVTGPVEQGIVPGTGALVAPIEMATGKKAYFVGKPNPLMMRSALKILGCRREETVIIGDRMDTDILAGIESEITTVLVLSGVTAEEDVKRFAYRPDYILKGVGGIFKEQ
jgi:NagD protein